MKKLAAFVTIFSLLSLIWVQKHFADRPFVSDVSNADARPDMAALIPVSLPKPRVMTSVPALEPAPTADLRSFALVAAKAYLDAHSEEWDIQAYHEMRPVLASNPLGSLVTYQAYQDGLPIVGMEIRLRLDRDNQVVDVTNNYHAVPKVELDSPDNLSAQDAVQKIPENFVVDSKNMTAAGTKELFATSDTEAELVYAVSTIDQDNNQQPTQLLIRASNGDIVSQAVARGEFKP